MSKKLTAYFSAIGVAKSYAEKIAKATGTYLFEIKPKIPYTGADLNRQDSPNRSSVEMKNPNSRPEIAEKLRFIRYGIFYVTIIKQYFTKRHFRIDVY